MLIPSNRANPLGGEHRVQADFSEEVRGTHSEQVAEFLNREDVQILMQLGNALEVSGAVARGVVGEDAFFVDVFPPTFKVDQSNSVIENGLYFLNLKVALPESENGPFDEFL